MSAKIKAKSRIFEAVHETASDLHRLGFMDPKIFQKFDTLRLNPAAPLDRNIKISVKPPH